MTLKNIIFTPFIFSLLVAVFAFATAPTFGEERLALDLITANAELFSKSIKQYDAMKIIDGPIEYREIKDGDEGYIPSSTINIEGTYTRTVYDFSSEESPLMMTKDLEQELSRKGFDIVFSCRRIECGDMAGWRLYVSDLIDGTSENQHYVLAKHAINENENWYIAFYVNEFSNRPRAIIDVIATQPIKLDVFTINQALLRFSAIAGNTTLLREVLFAFDSAVIPEKAFNELDTLGAILKDTPDLNLDIYGYSDGKGTKKYNENLSQNRADAVKRYLVVQKKIDPSRLKAEGKGVSINTLDAGREDYARRVEIVKQTKQLTNNE
jgi:OmpA-OmpF porin, OOP family